MTRYYIPTRDKQGLEEITAAEWFELYGEGDNQIYARKVYTGEMRIDDVPEGNREAVSSIVANKVARWGTYENQSINSDELVSMIEGVL